VFRQIRILEGHIRTVLRSSGVGISAVYNYRYSYQDRFAGKPLFCQERVGKNRRIFILYKFRSRYKDHDDIKYQTYIQKYVQDNLASVTDEAGEDIYELIHDPRVTKIGLSLRRSNLDELPQFINII